MNTNKFIRIIILFTGIVSMASSAIAQVVVSAGGSYNQDFNTPSFATEVAAAGAGVATWTFTNNSTYPGWMRQVNSGGLIDRTDKDFIGEILNGNTVRFGNVGNSGTYPEPTTDRTLMSLIRAVGSEVSFGVIFQVSGADVAGIDVSYTGEQWFRAVNANTLEFQYKILSSFDAGTFKINDETGLTDANSLDFTALKTGTGQVMNGNFDGDIDFSANNISRSDSISLSASDGQYIALRWRQVDQFAGVVQSGLGVDDFSVSFTAVPEPATYALLFGLATLGLVMYRRRRAQP